MIGFRAMAFVLVLLAGCKKERLSPGVYVGETNRTIAAMVPEDVIVKVNHAVFTRSDYDLMLSGMEKTFRLRNPGVGQAALGAQRRIWEKSVVGEFVTKELLVQEAERRGLKASAANWETVKATLLEGLAASKNVPAEKLAESSEADVRMAYELAQANALILTLREHEFGDKLNVTGEDIAKARRWITRYNEICAQTNELVMARGRELCQRIREGADFLEVAKEVTDDQAYPDGVWGEFARAEIGDAKVAEAAFALPVGGVSEPFDTEEGLVIIKVLDRKGVDSPAAMEAATVKLGRIVIRMLAEVPEKSDKILRRELEQARLKEFQVPWRNVLKEKARIEYPNGTNFFGKAGNRPLRIGRDS
jgi:hypothetical protein